MVRTDPSKPITKIHCNCYMFCFTPGRNLRVNCNLLPKFILKSQQKIVYTWFGEWGLKITPETINHIFLLYLLITNLGPVYLVTKTHNYSRSCHYTICCHGNLGEDAGVKKKNNFWWGPKKMDRCYVRLYRVLVMGQLRGCKKAVIWASTCQTQQSSAPRFTHWGSFGAVTVPCANREHWDLRWTEGWTALICRDGFRI